MYEDCLLNASIVSDIHIDVDWPIGEWIWATGLNDLERSKDPIDALIVSGDLTNYGDKESIESFFNIMAESDCAENWVTATGNHEIGHVDDTTQEGARQRFVDLYNSLNPSGHKIEKAYYKIDINGYRFVVLCDDGNLAVVEARNLKKGDKVILGRTEKCEDGIYLHCNGFVDESAEAIAVSVFEISRARTDKPSFIRLYSSA